MAESIAPEPGTPEYQQWLIEHSKPLIDCLFEHPIPEDVAQAEDGLIAGPERWDQLMPEKTIPEDIAMDKAHQRSKLNEAVYFLKNCPDTKMDGDGDGVPCERQFNRF